MTNELTTAKAQFATALTDAGLTVKEFIPERFVPPIVIIAASGNYLTKASVSAEYNMNLDLMLVAQTATNVKATEQLDELIQDTLRALPNWVGLVDVSQPFTLQTNNAEYLTATVRVDLRITI